ncbi:MAG: hypothetical protein ACRD99_05945 [Nitrososphaera sp.]
MQNQITFDLRKAGIISFVIGVIMFFSQGYLSWGLVSLSSSLAQENQLAIDMVSATFLSVWNGAIVLIIAGSAMFYLGGRKEKASPPAAK